MIVTLPALPISISYLASYSTPLTIAQIDEIYYNETVYGSIDTVYITVTLIGTKKYDQAGIYYGRACRIAYKVYDEYDFVVDSGTCITEKIKAGEKFKETFQITFFDWSKLSSHSFRIVLLNAS